MWYIYIFVGITITFEGMPMKGNNRTKTCKCVKRFGRISYFVLLKTTCIELNVTI